MKAQSSPATHTNRSVLEGSATVTVVSAGSTLTLVYRLDWVTPARTAAVQAAIETPAARRKQADNTLRDLLEQCVERWSYQHEGSEPQPVPVTRREIRKLNRDQLVWLFQVIGDDIQERLKSAGGSAEPETDAAERVQSSEIIGDDTG
ncbi:MAG: hypothetical protein HY329_09700 [Chloroflexi bacterium]|nr:hypothetical protein [Chloroflexota bacterium]